RNRRQQDAPGGGKGHAPRRQRWQRDDRRVSRGDELRQRRRECLHQRDGRHQSVLGGSAGNDSIWTAAGDTIHGGSNNETVGGVAGVTMLGGSGGNQFLDASQKATNRCSAAAAATKRSGAPPPTRSPAAPAATA